MNHISGIAAELNFTMHHCSSGRFRNEGAVNLLNQRSWRKGETVLPAPNKYRHKINTKSKQQTQQRGVERSSLTGPEWRIKVADYDVNTMKDFWQALWFGFSFHYQSLSKHTSIQAEAKKPDLSAGWGSFCRRGRECDNMLGAAAQHVSWGNAKVDLSHLPRIRHATFGEKYHNAHFAP